ncbi:AbrB/MazE/SpoVT family DNA-binding domain-containing protein [Lactobacillus sp. CBA3605]|uniref:AbrB/MazE/SpoVT family DNA-binding domain-containing protein n=1 Tax=Lactobacillus sp. CBA3605 TaxID=2099788 RepID=UPI00131A1F68|nr:AbrB/MazE/SpoVT family DNA-binding domain-containing protein [Lactobacillus sp. CBA3605]
MPKTTKEQTTYTIKMSRQGQFTIPAELRRELNIQGGDEMLIREDKNSNLVLEKKPTATDWENAVAGLPIERVVLNEDGSVNAKKSPFFANWMKEDDYS